MSWATFTLPPLLSVEEGSHSQSCPHPPWSWVAISPEAECVPLPVCLSQVHLGPLVPAMAVAPQHPDFFILAALSSSQPGAPADEADSECAGSRDQAPPAQ